MSLLPFTDRPYPSYPFIDLAVRIEIIVSREFVLLGKLFFPLLGKPGRVIPSMQPHIANLPVTTAFGSMEDLPMTGWSMGGAAHSMPIEKFVVSGTSQLACLTSTTRG